MPGNNNIAIKDITRPLDYTNPILIKGKPYTINGDDSGLCLDGNRLWPCSIALAELVSPVADSELCFLGDGLGLPSIVAAQNNNIVTVIEREPRIWELIHNNYRDNNCWAKFRVEDWAKVNDKYKDNFDAIYGSEIIYNSYNLAGLINFIKVSWNGHRPCKFVASSDKCSEDFMNLAKPLDIRYSLLDSSLPEPCHYWEIVSK